VLFLDTLFFAKVHDLHCVRKKPQTILDRSVKSQCILTKLSALDYEYISERITKFCVKIFIKRGVTNLQISIPCNRCPGNDLY